MLLEEGHDGERLQESGGRGGWSGGETSHGGTPAGPFRAWRVEAVYAQKGVCNGRI